MDSFIRFHWLHSTREEFEVRIERSAGDNQWKLLINDYTNEKDVVDKRQLWSTRCKIFHRFRI